MVASFELLDQTLPEVLLLPAFSVMWTSTFPLYHLNPFDLKFQLLAAQIFQNCTDQQGFSFQQGLLSVTAQEELILAACAVALLQLN